MEENFPFRSVHHGEKQANWRWKESGKHRGGRQKMSQRKRQKQTSREKKKSLTDSATWWQRQGLDKRVGGSKVSQGRRSMERQIKQKTTPSSITAGWGCLHRLHVLFVESHLPLLWSKHHPYLMRPSQSPGKRDAGNSSVPSLPYSHLQLTATQILIPLSLLFHNSHFLFMS